MSRVQPDTSVLRRIVNQPLERADRRTALRQAAIGEEREQLTIEKIRADLDAARQATRKTAEVQRIMASGAQPEEIYKGLLQVDPNSAEAYRGKLNADSAITAPAVQQTPEFSGTLQTQQAPLPELGIPGLMEQGTPAPQTIGENTVAMPAQPRQFLGIGGNMSQIMNRSAREVLNEKFGEESRSKELASELRREEQAPQREQNRINAESNRLNQERLNQDRLADNVRADTSLNATQAQQTATLDAAAQRHSDDMEQRRLDRNQRAVTAAETARARNNDKPPTAANLRAFGFFMRAKDAVDILEGIEKDVQAMGTGEQYWTAIMPNVMQTQLGQTLEQAQRQFTEARLRKDSGAAIPPAEYENDKKTYFVAPGDTKETLQRKRNARSVLVKALKMESGKAYTQSYGDDEASTPIVQKNERTGAFRYSTDGGKTWLSGKPPQ